jgi:YVTN family beta-propeller protein
MHARWAIALWVTASLVGLVAFSSSSKAGATVLGSNIESRAIALTPNARMLLVVNPDSNSLSLVDIETRAVTAEVPVGIDPRCVAVAPDSAVAYVANRGSNDITIVDVTNGASAGSIDVGVRPYGVVVSPDGTRLYVAEQGQDQLRILDTATRETLARISTADRPSGLALSSDGHILYVTHLLSPFLTVLEGVDGPIDEILTRRIALWPDSNLLQSIVLSPDGLTGYVPHTRSNSANMALTFDTTVFPLVSLVNLDTETHRVGAQFDLGTLDPPGVGLPFDAAVTPDGRELWVVNAASNDLSILDLERRNLAAHIEVEDNPRAIVLSPDGATVYVNNTLAGTVSVIDTAIYAVVDTIPVTDIPLPPILLAGKKLFHSSDDPRMSKAQWIACNTCHFEGEHDGQTWTFGFAGPRNTTSLLGMIETYPLRWSGEWDESADSEFAARRENFGAGLIDGEMNCQLFPPDCVDQPPNQGRSYELDALAAFIDSLRVPLSPDHALGQPLTDAERRGQEIFHREDVGCAFCHPSPLYTDLKMHDVGTATANERIGPSFDTPTLRGLYDSAPYFHDGSADLLRDTLTFASPNSEHDMRGILTEAEIDDLIAFLLALPYEE